MKNTQNELIVRQVRAMINSSAFAKEVGKVSYESDVKIEAVVELFGAPMALVALKIELIPNPRGH